MNISRNALKAGLALTLMAGSWGVALAGSVSGQALDQIVQSQYRNIQYCDRRSNIEEFYPSSNDNNAPDDGVIFEKVSFLAGSGYFTDRFSIDSAGSYQVTLTDFSFPQPFVEMGLNITSATQSFGSVIGAGSFSFDADPGDYYLSFFGEAPDLGQYGIEIAQYGIQISQPGNVSAVPVPAAAWLFGSGLIGMTGILRRRKS